MKSLHFLLGITCIASLTGCVSSAQVEPNSNLDRARQTLDSLYLNYSVDNSSLLEKTIPSTNNIPSLIWHQKNRLIFNQFSYLWPYSGTFSAVNALFEATHDKKYKKLLDSRVLPGLEEYFDTQRVPNAYSSHISGLLQASDRFLR